MTRASVARGFVRLALASVVLTWVTGSSSHGVPLDVASTPTHAAALGSIPDLFLPAAGKPVLTPYTRLNEGQRGIWVTPPTSVIHPPVPLLDILSSPLMLSAGRVAQGLSGRGPPSLSDP